MPVGGRGGGLGIVFLYAKVGIYRVGRGGWVWCMVW